MNTGPHSRPRVAVFDLDGTLFDSLPAVLRAIRHALEPFESRPLGMEIFPQLGGPPERFFPLLLKDERDAPAALQRLSAYVAKNGWDASPYEGALATLRSLRAGGVGTAVWTGRDRASTLELVRRHDFERFLDVLVCGDDFPTHKPDPEGMSSILARLAARREDVMFVGDSDVDARSGEASGVRTILIQSGRTVPDEVARSAWRVVHGPAEAYALVEAWARDGDRP